MQNVRELQNENRASRVDFQTFFTLREFPEDLRTKSQRKPERSVKPQHSVKQVKHSAGKPCARRPETDWIDLDLVEAPTSRPIDVKKLRRELDEDISRKPKRGIWDSEFFPGV